MCPCYYIEMMHSWLDFFPVLKSHLFSHEDQSHLIALVFSSGLLCLLLLVCFLTEVQFTFHKRCSL